MYVDIIGTLDFSTYFCNKEKGAHACLEMKGLKVQHKLCIAHSQVLFVKGPKFFLHL